MRDKYYYINRLPEFELSYDNILHKKVFSDLYALIPVGNKVIAWFTYELNKNVCILFHLNKYNIITHTEISDVCYDKVLSYGTMLYGTLFKYNGYTFITTEDIYYYKGNYIQKRSIRDKMNILNFIFKNLLQQKAYTKNFVIFGMPYMDAKIQNVFNKIKEMPYQISSIQFYNLDSNKNSGILINKQQNNIENIFKIKANIEQDIYSLYCKGNKTEDFYGYAGIFDYKTSVMMNKHFRKIKENKNLDLLEMSDSEDEFENVNEDKFVNLKKIVYMKCKYNRKFKKWQPIEIVNFGEKLLTKREIQTLEYNKN